MGARVGEELPQRLASEQGGGKLTLLGSVTDTVTFRFLRSESERGFPYARLPSARASKDLSKFFPADRAETLLGRDRDLASGRPQRIVFSAFAHYASSSEQRVGQIGFR